MRTCGRCGIADDTVLDLDTGGAYHPELRHCIATLRAQLAGVREKVEKMERRRHYECDDCWYSCPLSEEGCCNDGLPHECNCGADDFNAQIADVLAALDGAA